jgi:nucleoid-associated protein EbfC
MPQPNMQQLLKQAQKMQEEMAKAQDSLKDEVVTASSGGGVVTVEVTGEMVVKSITIAPEAVDPDDVEMLSDLVLAAVNQGIEKSQQLAAERMNAVTGGMGGGLGLPGF